jgi:bleomycin hydrolase
VKTSNLWNEDAALATIRSILDHYIGAPPGVVSVNGKSMTPPEYLANVLTLRLDDYVDVLSLKGKPYYQKVEYEVGDNWWHNADYLNVPLDDFVALVKKAIRAGYSVALGGDTSEPGYDGHAGIGVVPTFDIPTTFINDDARAFRFYNGTTGDDHGIHLVGYTQKDGSDWYLIKDSGSGSRNNTHPGYYFYREDYVKLKMMDVLVHKDMVRELLARSGE